MSLDTSRSSGRPTRSPRTKIKRFDCYPGGSIILTQLGVINNLSAALE